MTSRSKKLHNHSMHLRHILICMNVMVVLVGIALVALCLWMRFDADIQDWVNQLNITAVYIGIYILIVASLLMIGSGVLSTIAILSEAELLLIVNIGYQALCFVLGLSGAAVLVDYSSFQSSIHEIIQRAMISLIHISPYNSDANNALSMVQESMGCCGANGPNDYLNIRRALPSQCRDTVTGNAFFYGCADEMTWFMEQRSSWIAGICCFLCFLNVFNASLTLILLQIKKEGNH